MRFNETQIANRIKWVRALRSGKYKQGQYTLKKIIDGIAHYCCLGVACEVVIPANYVIVIRGHFSSSNGTAMTDDDATTYFGMGSSDQNEAMGWNDCGKYTFKRIADFVAWATAHEMTFEDIVPEEVPRGYSAKWLRQSDDNPAV